MFNFILPASSIFQAVRWERVFRCFSIFKKLCLFLCLSSAFLFLVGFFELADLEFFTKDFLSETLGIFVISLVLTLGFWMAGAFFDSRLKKPRLRRGFDEQAKLLEEVMKRPEEFNLAEFLSFEVAKAVHKSSKFANPRNIQVTPSVLCYFLLKDNPGLGFVFSRGLLDIEVFKKELGEYIKEIPKNTKVEQTYSQEFRDCFVDALEVAQKKGHDCIGLGDMISALSSCEPVFKKLLIGVSLTREDVENLCLWFESLKEKIERTKTFWDPINLAKKGSLAKDWAAGYSITLDKYSIDWTELIKRKEIGEIVGHKTEIEAMERVLARTQVNNVLLVGEIGSGRKSSVYDLATKAFFGTSLPNINHKRVVQLDLPRLLSQLEDQEAIESVLGTILKEASSAGNIILVIDEFHNFVGEISGPGTIDISGILSPYLRLPQFQMIAITTFRGLHRYIEERPSILTLCEKVEVSEISPRETIVILEDFALYLEKKYKKFVTYPAIRDIVSLSAKYLPNIPFPKKAIDILDEVMVEVARSTKEYLVLPKHVAKIISEKIEVPVGELEAKEREVLLNLENLIHKRIINQDEAVKEACSALRRARARITVRKGPMGAFLFLGPTGVGKTETSKALSEVYFGSEDKMIRLDMSEFQLVSDIPRLIGSPGQEGLLTTQIRESPFSLVLLDELEKAHPDILNLFLQVFDEGHLTDGSGRKVSFLNSIIIATSNAGYKIILKALKEKAKWSGVKQELLDYLFQEAIFRPEFINRFDAVVVFKPLSKENLLDIAELMLQKLVKNLDKKGIEFIITKPLKEKIVKIGFSPVFGAREMRRVIQEKVENVLATAVLSKTLKGGNRVKIDPHTFKLIILS